MSFPYLSDVVYFLTGYRVFLPLATFGILVAVAMLTGASCLRRELARLHACGQIGMARRPASVQVAPQNVVSDFMVVVLVAGIIGARLFHILEHGALFLKDPLSMIFSRSGLSVFGGLIFGAIAGL